MPSPCLRLTNAQCTLQDAFWCLCALIEDILGSSYFDERMVSVQVRPRVARRQAGWLLPCARPAAPLVLNVTLCTATFGPRPAPRRPNACPAGGCAGFWSPAAGAIPDALGSPAGARRGCRLCHHVGRLGGRGAMRGPRACAHPWTTHIRSPRQTHCNITFSLPLPPRLPPCRHWFLCAFLNSLPLDSTLRGATAGSRCRWNAHTQLASPAFHLSAQCSLTPDMHLRCLQCGTSCSLRARRWCCSAWRSRWWKSTTR